MKLLKLLIFFKTPYIFGMYSAPGGRGGKRGEPFANQYV
jgi:hypothetical protein